MYPATSRAAQGSSDSAKRRCDSAKNGQARWARSDMRRLPVGWCDGAPHVAQLEPLNLAGGRLRQAVDEFDPARIFPRADRALHMHFQLVVQRSTGHLAAAVLEH